ncbi:Six-hairpin glycosidase-like protein [Leptodontidium sp. 2 PMI_412]|nr:Six-hairpin glycosidase-like protein [Leptodontidium sp. 2 PMI_412]
MAPMAIQSPTLGTASWDPLTKENIPLIVERVTGSTNRKKSKHDGLEELYSENIFAKLVRVAVRDLEGNNPPTAYPEYVPQDEVLGPVGRYHLRESDFWTCGFFPGTLYSLLDRLTRYPKYQPRNVQRQTLEAEIISLSRSWSGPLHAMAARTDTHDLGFIIEPALRMDWELLGNSRSLQSLIAAAYSLASRYEERAQAIRSWDLINKKDIQIISMEENFIVIIDSLCNLDMLYYASKHSGDSSLAEIATKHARTLLKTHLRPESVPSISKNGYQGQLYSTCHVTNIDPRTGAIKARMTAQGYDNSSTWARGQSWAVLGYAQTYNWTKDPIFLDAAMGCAEYFLHRLEKQQEIDQNYKIPLWDFDGPIENKPVWDSSAGVIAANGMLILSESLASFGQAALSRRFCDAAISLVETILEWSLSEEKAKFVSSVDGEVVVEDVVEGHSFDSILKNATANNNAGARKRYSNHGLVYGDYYLVQFGNRLLDMGLI